MKCEEQRRGGNASFPASLACSILLESSCSKSSLTPHRRVQRSNHSEYFVKSNKRELSGVFGTMFGLIRTEIKSYFPLEQHKELRALSLSAVTSLYQIAVHTTSGQADGQTVHIFGALIVFCYRI